MDRGERDEFLISRLNYYEINCEFDISSYHSLPLSISSIIPEVLKRPQIMMETT